MDSYCPFVKLEEVRESITNFSSLVDQIVEKFESNNSKKFKKVKDSTQCQDIQNFQKKSFQQLYPVISFFHYIKEDHKELRKELQDICTKLIQCTQVITNTSDTFQLLLSKALQYSYSSMLVSTYLSILTAPTSRSENSTNAKIIIASTVAHLPFQQLQSFLPDISSILCKLFSKFNRRKTAISSKAHSSNNFSSNSANESQYESLVLLSISQMVKTMVKGNYQTNFISNSISWLPDLLQFLAKVCLRNNDKPNGITIQCVDIILLVLSATSNFPADKRHVDTPKSINVYEICFNFCLSNIQNISPAIRYKCAIGIGIAVGKATSSSFLENSDNIIQDSHDDSSKHDGNITDNLEQKSSSNSLASASKSYISKLTVRGRKKTADFNFSSIEDAISFMNSALLKNLKTVNHPVFLIVSLGPCFRAYFEYLHTINYINSHTVISILKSLMQIIESPSEGHPDLSHSRDTLAFAVSKGILLALSQIEQQELFPSLMELLKTTNDKEYSQLSFLLQICNQLIRMLHDAIPDPDNTLIILKENLKSLKLHVRFNTATAIVSLGKTSKHIYSIITENFVKEISEICDSLSKMEKLYPMVHGVAVTCSILLLESRDNHVSILFLDSLFDIATKLIETQFLKEQKIKEGIILTNTRAGFLLVSSLVTQNSSWLCQNIIKILDLSLKCVPLRGMEPTLELIRLEAIAVAITSLLRYEAKTINNILGAALATSEILGSLLSVCLQELSVITKPKGKKARLRLISWVLEAYTYLHPPLYTDLFGTIFQYTSDSIINGTRLNDCLKQMLYKEDDGLEMKSMSYINEIDHNERLIFSNEFIFFFYKFECYSLMDSELEILFHDNFYRSFVASKQQRHEVNKSIVFSGPLCDVRGIDSCIIVFCKIFGYASQEMQSRCLQQLCNALSTKKENSFSSINIATVLLGIIQQKKKDKNLQSNSYLEMIQGILFQMLGHHDLKVRRCAAQSIGELISFLPNNSVICIVHDLENKLKDGNSLEKNELSSIIFTLACAKRSCLSLNVDIGLLYNFGGDISLPVRSWLLHSWLLILESTRISIELEHLVNRTLPLIAVHISAGTSISLSEGDLWHANINYCLARLTNAILLIVGPEFDSCKDRMITLLTIWEFLLQYEDSRVLFEYRRFLSQLSLFSPRSLNRKYVVNQFQIILLDNNKTVFEKQMALRCLQSLLGKDKNLVIENHVYRTLFSALDMELIDQIATKDFYFSIPFMYSSETDKCSNELITDYRATMLSLSSLENLNIAIDPCLWILFCRGLILGTESKSNDYGRRTSIDMDENNTTKDISNSTARIVQWRKARLDAEKMLKDMPLVRWQTKTEALNSIVVLLKPSNQDTSRAHFDVFLARKEMEMNPGSNFDAVCLYLDELVSLACQSITAQLGENELGEMRLTGMRLLWEIISQFSKAIDPDETTLNVPLLCQYSIQIASSIKQCLTSSFIPQLMILGCKTVTELILNKIITDTVAIKRLLNQISPNISNDKQEKNYTCREEDKLLRNVQLICFARMYNASLYQFHSEPFHIFFLKYISSMLDSFSNLWFQLIGEQLLLLIDRKEIEIEALVLTSLFQEKVHRLKEEKCSSNLETNDLNYEVLLALALAYASGYQTSKATPFFLLTLITSLMESKKYYKESEIYILARAIIKVFEVFQSKPIDPIHKVGFLQHTCSIIKSCLYYIKKTNTIEQNEIRNLLYIIMDKNGIFKKILSKEFQGRNETLFILLELLTKEIKENIIQIRKSSECVSSMVKVFLLEFLGLIHDIIPVELVEKILFPLLLFNTKVFASLHMIEDVVLLNQGRYNIKVYLEVCKTFSTIEKKINEFNCTIEKCTTILLSTIQVEFHATSIAYLQSLFLLLDAHSSQSSTYYYHQKIITIIKGILLIDGDIDLSIKLIVEMNKLLGSLNFDKEEEDQKNNKTLLDGYLNEIGSQISILLYELLENEKIQSDLFRCGIEFLLFALSKVSEKKKDLFILLIFTILMKSLNYQESKSLSTQFLLSLAKDYPNLFRQQVSLLQNTTKNTLECALRAGVSLKEKVVKKTPKTLDLSRY